jgi:hypothetical protein
MSCAVSSLTGLMPLIVGCISLSEVNYFEQCPNPKA